MSRLQIGVDYETLPRGRWRFRLLRDVSVPLPKGAVTERHHYHDADRNLWLTMRPGEATISRRYAWDGASPKVNILGLWLGTPDTPGTLRATLWHDALWQFLHMPCFPLTVKQTDAKFRAIMAQDGAPIQGAVYYRAVRMFGGLYRWIGSPDNGLYCGEHQP
jgi:hypothetical protein